ncbi:spermatogenesis-associated protein 33 isoform X2 [Sceloporus undulatus]|uniref:spermatogenesis-associated protein 33 isoform X2 n=1 Tax=Sceloporus undulatus TaxID=8520 RepID=UPI001C4BC7FB|nr:spermatogenesis-associated protein 33 isoform X2 [Sceloporus undulatus]
MASRSSSQATHMPRNAETSKPKDAKTTFQETSPHPHPANVQPSTSRAVRKPPPVGEVSTDKIVRKKRLIPKIIVTGPSEEVLVNSLTDILPETRTIRDTEEYGPYNVHTKPSTVDAYRAAKDQ